jgi:hypothetical protein
MKHVSEAARLGGKFYLIPKDNSLSKMQIECAAAYWAGVFNRKAGVSTDGSFTYHAEDINRELMRECGLLGSITKVVRQAFELFYVFECHMCRKQAERVLSAPLRSVYYETQRRPPTRCRACEEEAARDHDEEELDRATDFLLRKIKPRAPAAEAPKIIAAAQSISISLNHLTRARHKLGIVSFKAGNVWRWMWPVPEVEEFDPYPWRSEARAKEKQNAA